MTLAELMKELERVSKLVPGDIEVIGDRDRFPHLFSIKGVEVDGVVRIKMDRRYGA